MNQIKKLKIKINQKCQFKVNKKKKDGLKLKKLKNKTKFNKINKQILNFNY